MYLVELKTATSRLAPIRRLWHQRAAGIGVTVYVLAGETGVDRWMEQVAADGAFLRAVEEG